MPQMSELSPGLASGKWDTAVTDIRGYLGPGGRENTSALSGSWRPKASPIPSVPSSPWALTSPILFHFSRWGRGRAGRGSLLFKTL